MANDTPATTPSPDASHPGRFADSLSGGPSLQDDTIVFLIGKAFVAPLDPSSPTFDKPIHNFLYPSIVTQGIVDAHDRLANVVCGDDVFGCQRGYSRTAAGRRADGLAAKPSSFVGLVVRDASEDLAKADLCFIIPHLAKTPKKDSRVQRLGTRSA